MLQFMGARRVCTHLLVFAGLAGSLPACVARSGGVDPASLVGRETVLDVAPWCLLSMDEAGPGLYEARVTCKPRYSMEERAPAAGELCNDPPYAHPVLALLCDQGFAGAEAVMILTLRQWDDLVEALADRGLAGGP